MVATSGGRLLADDAADTLIRELIPLAQVITPNIPEGEVLCGFFHRNAGRYGTGGKRYCRESRHQRFC